MMKRSWGAVALSLGLGLQGVAMAECIAFDGSQRTITASGEYCLTRDVSDRFGNIGITILADDVVLDLQGHVISGLSSVQTGNPGILADGRNITIKGGSVIGFPIGIELRNSAGGGVNTVDGVLVSASVGSNAAGIRVSGPGIVVRNSVVAGLSGTNVRGIEVWGVSVAANSGNSMAIENNRIVQIRSVVAANDTVAHPDAAALAQVFGILVRNASNARIQNNVIADLQPGAGGAAVGIDFGSAAIDFASSLIYNNQIIDRATLPLSAGILAATQQSNSMALRVISNDITKFDTGISVGTTGTKQPNVARNVVRYATTPYVGGNQSNNQ